MKLLLILPISISLSLAQNVQTVEPQEKPKYPKPDSESTSSKNNIAPVRVNPFGAGNNGITAQGSRQVRNALNATEVKGIIHTSNGNKMAVLEIRSVPNPLFVSVGTVFSIQISGGEWRDVEVVDINKFEVKLTPKGSDGKIIIR